MRLTCVFLAYVRCCTNKSQCRWWFKKKFLGCVTIFHVFPHTGMLRLSGTGQNWIHSCDWYSYDLWKKDLRKAPLIKPIGLHSSAAKIFALMEWKFKPCWYWGFEWCDEKRWLIMFENISKRFDWWGGVDSCYRWRKGEFYDLVSGNFRQCCSGSSAQLEMPYNW